MFLFDLFNHDLGFFIHLKQWDTLAIALSEKIKQ